MRVEVVDDEPNDFRLGIIPIDELLYALHKVSFSASRGHFHMAPARMGLEEHKQITCAVALILIIVALGLPWLSCLRLTHFSDQLVRTLVKAHHGKARIVGL